MPVLLVVDLIVLNTARETIEEAVLDSRREMAYRTAEEIARIFSPIVSNLKDLAQTVGTDPQDLDALLKKAALASSEVEAFYTCGRPKPNTDRQHFACTARFLRLGRDLGAGRSRQLICCPDRNIQGNAQALCRPAGETGRPARPNKS